VTPLAALMLRSASEAMRGRVMGMRMLAVWGYGLHACVWRRGTRGDHCDRLADGAGLAISLSLLARGHGP
jgi:hypothetical protein